jgi:hypothetical protein
MGPLSMRVKASVVRLTDGALCDRVQASPSVLRDMFTPRPGRFAETVPAPGSDEAEFRFVWRAIAWSPPERSVGAICRGEEVGWRNRFRCPADGLAERRHPMNRAQMLARIES